MGKCLPCAPPALLWYQVSRLQPQLYCTLEKSPIPWQLSCFINSIPHMGGNVFPWFIRGSG